jgi:hypothetical protein
LQPKKLPFNYQKNFTLALATSRILKKSGQSSIKGSMHIYVGRFIPSFVTTTVHPLCEPAICTRNSTSHCLPMLSCFHLASLETPSSQKSIRDKAI